MQCWIVMKYYEMLNIHRFKWISLSIKCYKKLIVSPNERMKEKCLHAVFTNIQMIMNIHFITANINQWNGIPTTAYLSAKQTCKSYCCSSVCVSVSDNVENIDQMTEWLNDWMTEWPQTIDDWPSGIFVEKSKGIIQSSERTYIIDRISNTV